jgi:hypothetical protein
LILLGLAGCGSSDQTADEVAASVGRVTITRGQIAHRVAVMSAGHVPSRGSRRYRQMQEHALELLITAQWILQEAPVEHRRVGAAAVTSRLREKEHATFPGGPDELDEYLKQTGQTQADLRREVELELTLARLHEGISKSLWPPTSVEIAAYYKLHKNRFGLPELREVYIIDRKSMAAARAVRLHAERGVRFGSFARTEVATGTRGAGGHAPNSPLEAAIDRARLHTLEGPVKYGPDYLVFELKRLVKASYLPLSAVRAQIVGILTAEKHRVALARFVREWRARWINYTECEPNYIVYKCREYNGPHVAENPLSIE